MSSITTPFTFTDSDGDTFIVSNIRRDFEADTACVTFDVPMNGNENIETLEWVEGGYLPDNFDGSNLEVNHRGMLGSEAITAIHHHLAGWLSVEAEPLEETA